MEFAEDSAVDGMWDKLKESDQTNDLSMLTMYEIPLLSRNLRSL